MPKPVSLERKLCAKAKNLGISLSALKAEIDAGDGNLRRIIKLNRNRDSVRLIIRCRNAAVPEAWAMSVLYQNACIDCIDFHVTDYTDAEGVRRVGWHRDIRENNRTIQRVSLPNFKPLTLDQFIIEGLAIFNVILSPGGETDAHGQMRINT